jgi:hypothetical protein
MKAVSLAAEQLLTYNWLIVIQPFSGERIYGLNRTRQLFLQRFLETPPVNSLYPPAAAGRVALTPEIFFRVLMSPGEPRFSHLDEAGPVRRSLRTERRQCCERESAFC